MGQIWGCVDIHAAGDLAGAGRSPVESHSPAAGLVFSLCGFSGSFETASSAGDIRIAADAHLYDRQELIGALGLQARECQDLIDGQLILAAYQKWGVECPHFLSGEFAFAVWDTHLRRVFCCRDHLGTRRLYYSWDGRVFRFGTIPSVILTNTDLPRRLNRRKLAAMTIPRGHNYFHEDTFYADIMSLPPGQSLTADQFGIQKRVYFRPEIRPELVPASDDEAFEALRQLIFRAVRNHLAGSRQPGVLLSGGLDSSAVTAVAMKCLEHSGVDLVAISAVPPDRSRAMFGDEREYVNEFRDHRGLKIEFVTAEDRGPFDLIDDVRNYEAGFQRSSTWYIEDAMEDAALAHGVDQAMTGHGGEFGVTSRGGEYALELMARFRLGTLTRVLRELRASSGVSPVRLMAGEMLNSLFPLRHGRTFLYLQEAFRRECEARPIVNRHWPDHRKRQLDMLQIFLRTRANPDYHRPGGHLRYSSPLLDRRILEFCLAAPGDMKIRHGYPRYAVRRALEGVMPERIRWRTGQFLLAPDYRLRYAAQIGMARGFVAAIRPNDPVRSIVDVGKLARMIKLNETPPELECRVRIPATIALICFLRQFQEFRV